MAPTLGVPLAPPAPPTIQEPATQQPATQEPAIQEPTIQQPASDATGNAHGAHAGSDPHAADHHAAHRAAAHSAAAAGEQGDAAHEAAHADSAHADGGFGEPAVHADEAHHHAAPADVDYEAYHPDAHHETYEDHEPSNTRPMGHQLLGMPPGRDHRGPPLQESPQAAPPGGAAATLALFVTATVVGAQFLKPLLGTDKPSDYPGPARDK